MDTIKAKMEIARRLREQSGLVSEFQMSNFSALNNLQRLELARAIQALDARAADVLHDALEEGAEQADKLIVKFDAATANLREATAKVERIGDVLGIVKSVAKAAAAVVSGGIQPALGLLG